MMKREKLGLGEDQIFGSMTGLPKQNGRPHAERGMISRKKNPEKIKDHEKI